MIKFLDNVFSNIKNKNNQERFSISIPFFIMNKNGDIQERNTAFYDYQEILGKNIFENANAEHKQSFFDNFFNIDEDFFDLKITKENKQHLLRLFKGGKEEESYGIYFIDITKMQDLEVQVMQSQKMQVIGQLAGGIAHDFNNILTAIIGFTDLLLSRIMPSDPSFSDLMQIKQNSNRAAWLVSQLLAFSRKQTLQPKVINVSDELAEIANLIRRLIGANITLEMHHGKNLWDVNVDKVQLEQILINLAVNARDAMQQKTGIFRIKTSNLCVFSNKDLPKAFPKQTYFPDENELELGDYVLIEIEDTGTGIKKEIAEKIFEPFFTTKEVGKGTGLGLSTVYGIMKQTDGYIYFSSREYNEKTNEEGGTVFYLLFKKHIKKEEEALKTNEEVEISKDLTGNATILIVEDEPSVRMFASRALKNKGYKILEAESGNEGYEIMHSRGGNVNLIITDVVMPGMTGPSMIEKLMTEYPKTKVIFISGYGEDVFLKSFGKQRNFNFLPKPFALKDLVNKVKEVLSY